MSVKSLFIVEEVTTVIEPTDESPCVLQYYEPGGCGDIAAKITSGLNLWDVSDFNSWGFQPHLMLFFS